jgi:hypothetical protein
MMAVRNHTAVNMGEAKIAGLHVLKVI